MIYIGTYVSWFITVFALDRITKYMALGLHKPYVVAPFLEFKLVFNRGISWGMFHAEHPAVSLTLSIIIVSIISMLAWYAYKRFNDGHAVYAECAVLAGACSNVLDRFFYHGVIDFVHVHSGGWSWPIFNLADVAIVLGICWMVYTQYEVA